LVLAQTVAAAVACSTEPMTAQLPDLQLISFRIAKLTNAKRLGPFSDHENNLPHKRMQYLTAFCFISIGIV
jgi:hypothetical protein